MVKQCHICVTADMRIINKDLWHGGPAATFPDHTIPERRVIINKYFLYFLAFLVQQANCHDAIRAETRAVHAYFGHIQLSSGSFSFCQASMPPVSE